VPIITYWPFCPHRANGDICTVVTAWRPTATSGERVEISDYIRLLRKRWPLIAIVTVLAVVVAVAGTLATTRQYTATAQLFVSTQATDTATELLQGSSFTQQRVRSYASLVGTPRVLDPVIEELGLDQDARELREQVGATVPPETVLIDIAVTDPDPDTAARIANAVAISFGNTVSELEAPAEGQASPVKVSTVEEAVAPTSPSSPDLLRNLALALALGLAGGFGLALLRHTLDTAVRGEADVAQVSEANVLGGIAYDPEAPRRPLIVHASPHSNRAESFRQLRTNLQFVDAAHQVRSFVVTSSVPGEGKSTSTANLAITMADAGIRVCLIEGDLRRPKLAEYMGLENAVGLTTVLIGRADIADVLQPWGTGQLDLLSCGQVPPNPSELLGSKAMSDLLRKLEAEYDVVIVDAPPLLPVTDAAILSKIAGGAVLVVGSGKLNRSELARAVGTLESVEANLLGVVMNMLPTKGPDAYGYYSYDYAPDLPRQTRPSRADARRSRR